MELNANSGTLPTHTTVGGPALEQELSLSSTRCPTESGGTILLQLLEFKAHLLEAVEELHIRRDAETRFEDHTGKLVLEKQELEWEKESLRHQIEKVANEQTESLNNAKKQFQAKIRNIEEEKGKYQVSAELKDKEINSLKEELKSLQLQKYNLEKKASELEQKLVLQTRTKDSHLNQLGEVEKRFSALSRQCAMVKQAHEKLEQNVDEALKRNKKLTSVNEKQEAAVVSLKKELEEVSNKLIKARMTSRHDKPLLPTGTEQRLQQLHQRLNMETEMNEKLAEENTAVRAEKQEVMRSLQHSQQLLLSQTQTVSRVELELQTQREKYQALKQEHEVMQEKSKAMEDKMAQLMESYAASRISWDKEVRDSSQSLSVSTRLIPTSTEEIREQQTRNEPMSSSEVPHFDSVQHLASIQTKNPDCLEDTGAVTKLVTTGATGGQDIPNHHQQSHLKEPLNPLNSFTCPPTNNNIFSICCISGTTSSGNNKNMSNASTSERDPDAVSDLIHATSPVSDDGLLISKGSGMSEKEKGWKQGQNNTEEEERSEEQQLNGEKGEDVKEGGSAGEERRMLLAQTTDRADRREDSQRSTGDAGDTKKPETETKDRAGGEGTHAAEERRETGLHMPESQIRAQTATDTTTEKSDTQPVIDFMDSEPPVTACNPSDCSQSLCQGVGDKDAASCRVNKAYEMSTEVHKLHSDEHRSCGPKMEVMQDEVQSFSHDAESVPHLHHQELERTMEDKPSDVLTRLSEPVSQSVCSPQTEYTEPSAAQSDSIVSIQELETPTPSHTTTQPSHPSDVTCGMKQTDEMRVTHGSEERAFMRPVLEPQASPAVLEQESGAQESLIRDDDEDDDGDSNICKKREGQSNVDSHFNNAFETAQEKCNLSADTTMDPVELESDIETGGCQQHIKKQKIEGVGDAKTTKHDADLKLSAHPSCENGTSPETGGTTCHEEAGAKEMLLNDANEPSLPNKTHRSSFDWSKAQRNPGSHMSAQNIKGPGGLLGHPPSTIPMFLRGKHNKVPLVIISASDLLNASSVSGTAASSRRQQRGEWKAMGETDGETATADTESKASLSISPFPVSTPSISVSRLSWQTTTGRVSRAPTSASGLSSESEPSCSQEREDQQTSLRAHISKIEKFLDTERLRLPKRRRMDN